MKPRLFLCTDLDRTLLPNGALPESDRARSLFRQLVERPEVVLAYVTGRHLTLVNEAIENYSLPKPRFAVTDVGTRIHEAGPDGWRAWENWEAQIAAEWGGLTAESLHAMFADLDGLILQEATKLNLHKLSYYVPVDADHLKLTALMSLRLEERSIPSTLTWSVDEQAQVGLLDVLPSSAGKLQVIEYIRTRLGFSIRETVFAGDSGNDLPVLTSRIPSVLVANAASDVREQADREARETGTAEALYLARGGFLDMNGNYGAGILEGVLHFRPELRDWITPGPGPHL